MWIKRGTETFKVERFTEKLFELERNRSCRGLDCVDCPLWKLLDRRLCYNVFGGNGEKLEGWTIYGNLQNHRIGRFYR